VGREIQISESKRYFPAFICSLLQTTLELGIRGDLDDLAAVMIPTLCDSLKA
jgi:benzoyl-CoA reductase/2-hydroxyglutaryl-CoA dehydratase subunit BcrC/BadD/HgdB